MSSSHRGGLSHERGNTPTSIVSVRLTATERQALSAKADNAQLALSAFIRACALSSLDDHLIDYGDAPEIKAPKAKRLSSTERTHIALVLACMGRLIDTINAFEDEPVSEDNQPLMLACLKREIRQTRDQCFVSLGRKP